MRELINNVVKWAEDKNILDKANSFKQFTKCIEEQGEIASALCKNKPEELKDGIGDVMVTLIILAAQNGLDVEDCLQTAYDVIKNRTGRTENGVFIKNE